MELLLRHIYEMEAQPLDRRLNGHVAYSRGANGFMDLNLQKKNLWALVLILIVRIITSESCESSRHDHTVVTINKGYLQTELESVDSWPSIGTRYSSRNWARLISIAKTIQRGST